MKKKFLLLFILVLGISLLGALRAHAAIQNPGGGCTEGDVKTCIINNRPGQRTCDADGAWGECIANQVVCSINLNMPTSIVQGQSYYLSWSSNNVAGNLVGDCSDSPNHPTFPSLPPNQVPVPSVGTVTKTCTLSGVSVDGLACSRSVTQTVTVPPCYASLNWSPTSVTQGGSATANWNVTGDFDVVKLSCGGTVQEVDPDSSKTFGNLLADKTCIVKGYAERETPNGGTTLVQKCSSSSGPSATVSVTIPTCSSGDTQTCTVGNDTGARACNASTGSYVGQPCIICTGGQTRGCIPPGGGTGLQTCDDVNHVWNPTCVPGPECTPGPPPQTQSCTTSDAKPGTKICGANSKWGSCVANPVTPPLSISVSFVPPFLPGIEWRVDGPSNYSGAGNRTISNVPNGTYNFSITGGWAGRVVTGIIQNVSNNVINFTATDRMAQTGKGTLTVSRATLQDNQVQHVEGNASDLADGGKTLILSKGFVRVSNGQQQQGTPAYGWRGITTGANGTFSADVTYRCVGTDPTSFGDGDYTDTSAVTYDQGDHTGDTSPPVTETKLCGTSVSFGSEDDSGITPEPRSSATGTPAVPLPISWSLSGPYSTWDPSQERVSKPAANSYSMRVDEGTYTLSVVAPAGYTFYKIVGRAQHLISPGVVPSCTSLPCSFSAGRTSPYSFTILWTKNVTGYISCIPSSQAVEVGQVANLTGRNSKTYSWSAPDGNPVAGTTSDTFRVTYNSVGQKVVTVTGDGSASCLVNVVPKNNPPPSPYVDLKIKDSGGTIYSDGTITLQPGQSATLRWVPRDVDSCTASGNGWSGAKSASGGSETKTLVSPGLYNFTITCRNNSLPQNVSDTVHANVQTAALQVRLTANPSSGPAPLPVDLTAVVQGEVGSINYNFWWNCNSPATTFAGAKADCGDPVNPSVGKKLDGETAEEKLVNNVYQFPGAYIAKVVAERGSSSAEDRAAINVSGPPPIHFECISNACTLVSGAGSDSGGCNVNNQGSVCGGGFHYECVSNSCAKVNTPGGNKDGCSSVNVDSSCTDGGGGGNFHYGCVSNTCAKIDSPGNDTDGCVSSNVGASCTPGGGGPGGPGTCQFTATPSLISQGGSSLLSWSKCGSTCSVSGVGGGFSGTGSARVNPAKNTTYTLSCDSSAITKFATVKIFGLEEQVPTGP